MSSQAVKGMESISKELLGNQFVVPDVQTINKSGRKEEKTAASLQWDKELDIIIIKVLRGEKMLFQVPPDVIIEMAKYLRKNFLKGIFVNRTI
jgi:uncharacterized FlaG/YvyC family protein